jgi:dipeptidyl aminopeptidase/acylaminoacyl peptidase
MRFPTSPFCAGVLITVGIQATGAPPAAGADTAQWTVEAVVDTVAVKDAASSPDGQSVLFTRSRWRSGGAGPGPAWSDVWRVAAAGGEPEQLTFADAPDKLPAFSPDGRSIAFLSKRGEESDGYRVFVMPSSGGESRAPTPDDLNVGLFAWSPEGTSIAVVAAQPKSEERLKAEKEGRDEIVVDQDLRPRRIWIVDVASGEAEPLTSLGERSAWSLDWSPDGSALVAAVSERNRTDDSYMFKWLQVLPLEGEARDLVPIVGKIGSVAWSPDGATVAWLGGVDGSDPYQGSLFVVPAAGGTPKDLTGDREEKGEALAWLPDGRIALTAVTRTATGAWAIDPANGDRETLLAPGAVSFTATSWSADGRRADFVGSTAEHAPDVYVATPGAVPQRVTRSNPQLGGLPRGGQETIQWPARDGLEIEGIVIRPVGFREGTRYPLVVVVHGGPEGEYLDAWNNRYSRPGHVLAERGYVVFFPNYRGSTGRGVAYRKADHKDLGGREFTDVLDGIDALAEKGWIDRERVGITGGSYGGYFTALGVTRYSEHFAAGVKLFGITSWESFNGQSDIPIENAMVHWNLWCYEHVELCRSASAIGHIDKANTPTLILHGEEDLRVPKAQSDELYAALRCKKVPVEYVVYPREEHGFAEREHQIDVMTRLLGWLDRYLKPSGS